MHFQIKSRPYRFGLGKRSDDAAAAAAMDYDDAAYLADQQQNWRPWFDRGTLFWSHFRFEKNIYKIL